MVTLMLLSLSTFIPKTENFTVDYTFKVKYSVKARNEWNKLNFKPTGTEIALVGKGGL